MCLVERVSHAVFGDDCEGTVIVPALRIRHQLVRLRSGVQRLPGTSTRRKPLSISAV